MSVSLTMWYTRPCWLSVLAAVFGCPSDRHIGWHLHIAPPEGTDHWDSDTLEKDIIYVLISVLATTEWAFVSYYPSSTNITGVVSAQAHCSINRQWTMDNLIWPVLQCTILSSYLLDSVEVEKQETNLILAALTQKKVRCISKIWLCLSWQLSQWQFTQFLLWRHYYVLDCLICNLDSEWAQALYFKVRDHLNFCAWHVPLKCNTRTNII